MKFKTRYLAACSLLYLISTTSFTQSVAQSIAQINFDAAESCRQLGSLVIPDTKISLTEIVYRDSFIPPGSDESIATPPFCRIVGMTTPAVNFEVWLPLSSWNGNYQSVGNGGMAGTISYSAMANALRRGYATASTDTGHVAGPIPFDASWASGRQDLIEDFGHRALHLTTVNAKQVTEAFYQSPPDYSYYVGCSKGGQQGLMEAQRYPDDFDGIIAGDPANNWTRFYAGAHLWYSLAMLADEEAYIPPAKLPALGNAVNAACDTLDGIEDGILQNPLACNFEPATLTCPVGTDNNSCLTPKQVTAVEKIWSGVNNSAGELIYPGLVPGGEAYRGSWSTWVTGAEPYNSLHWRGGEGFFRWFVFNDADWDFRSFDFDKDLEYALEKVGSAVDSNDPDLRPLRDNGAKLIVYHGWSDPDISPVASINYYERVIDVIADDTKAINWQSALSQTQDFYRLFMVPGMAHCRGGPGPDSFDALTALENWVERGIAPETIIASKIIDGEVVRTRPLCAYPEAASYNGSGSTDDASNFSCVAPP
ncbi:MAG: tannase/feruloyl esterase family alpha/beta hydrolase [SAR86 cluster bacterium]|uniref:Tannase/feruloyl esterase family alpha/beta hydrolase n=1 Tax=SAR86 cluster bacterium TaxID=2030880 RepID=A0A2A5B9K1_9GAMM|nr:MAG: tannase/feruloyl esterase family alpha/beta hydrolase [SAR86 cluster bacterium]